MTAAAAPNILWLSAEDISPHFGCYDDPHAITPTIDQLAKEGVRYSNAFTTAGVCAPCRSGIITGMYQTTLGTHHMRCNAKLPAKVKPFPTYLREAGYYCTNNSKQDYQFKAPKGSWDVSSGKAHWRNRKDKSQPFFAVFNYTGCHESGIASATKYKSVTSKLTKDQRQDPKKLTTLPPYYPDTPTAREDWKRNYELITAMDAWAGSLIQQLKDDGVYDNTIIFFWSDHGVGLPRAKRWLYDSGTHTPLVVRIPEALRQAGQGQPGTVSDQLISSIDFGPTVLNLAGVKVPDHVQGQPFLGKSPAAPRDYVYGARDRMDERYDIIRMVRDKRFKYIRNYEPLKSYYQYMNTPEKGATMKEMRTLFNAGKLDGIPARYFAPSKPVEELYDTDADPHEVNNLAGDPKYKAELERMRQAQQIWSAETGDVGLVPESIITDLEAELGSPYAILRSKEGKAIANELPRIAATASDGLTALPELRKALKHDNATIRYWGATGIGNIGKEAAAAESEIRSALTDKSTAVRVAAARALCRLGKPDDALPVLVDTLKKGSQWQRLQASIVMDEIDEQAKPILAEMKEGLKPKKGLQQGGKYVVRVLNRALNELEGTNNTVR
jgi:uncharacterized sulfatase